ncbi:GntR family transcriptional regulator [Eisenbergiella sp.]
MAWNLDSDRPIYAQLLERIQLQIVSGTYGPGDKLPSVRELAAEASVNPNTMQKAFAELERSGLIVTRRTSGRFVTEDKEMITQIRTQLAKEEALSFIEKMKELGFEKKDILALLSAVAEEPAEQRRERA